MTLPGGRGRVLVDIVGFKIGTVVLPTSPMQHLLYETIAVAIGYADIFLRPSSADRPRAMSADAAARQTRQYERLLREALAGVDPQAQVVVFDASGLNRASGAVQSATAEAVADAVKQDRTIVVVVDSLKDSLLGFGDVIAPGLESRQIVVVGMNGATSLGDEDVQAAIAPVADQLRIDPIRGLRERLIRIPGWFPRYDDANRLVAYARNYYDATLASDELHTLLVDYLRDDRIELVVLESPRSEWLLDPISAACETLDLPRPVILDDLTELEDRRARAPVAVVTHLIESGRRIAIAADRLYELGHRGSLSLLGVLSTSGSLDQRGQRIVEGTRYVDYFVRVQQEVLPLDDVELALGRMPVEGRHDADAGALSVYEFWDLVRRVGTKEEEDVPRGWRESLGHVPDFPLMISQYGLWLSSRLLNVVRKATQRGPADILFLCPAERGAEAIADALERLFGCTVVKIPRRPWLHTNVLDLSGLVKNGELTGDPWMTQLRSATTPAVVALDEFTKTGGTLEHLVAVASEFNLEVKLAAVLVDLRPYRKRRELNVKSLYCLPDLNELDWDNGGS